MPLVPEYRRSLSFSLSSGRGRVRARVSPVARREPDFFTPNRFTRSRWPLLHERFQKKLAISVRACLCELWILHGEVHNNLRVENFVPQIELPISYSAPSMTK